MPSLTSTQFAAALSFTDVRDAFERTARIPSRSPEAIYHYTSADALLAILDTD